MPPAKPTQYFIQREATEEGPLSVAQINRLRQRGQVSPDTLCRAETDSAPRRLDEHFPHLKAYTGVDPEKMAKLKDEISQHELKVLLTSAFSAGAFFWVPFFGGAASFTAIVFGFVLVFRHRQPIGFAAIGLGSVGLCVRLAMQHRIFFG